jgi:hypothetical protein
MTLTAKTPEGIRTTKPVDCTSCNGNMIVWMKGFGWAACGTCEGTGVEPDHTYDAFAPYVERISR